MLNKFSIFSEADKFVEFLFNTTVSICQKQNIRDFTYKFSFPVFSDATEISRNF